MTTERHENTMTVAALIEALKQFNPSLPVYTEGCDCTGDAASVHIEDWGREFGEIVMIKR